MIRPATQQDIPAVIELSLEALSIDGYTGLVPSRERTAITVQECVCSAKNFSWVSEVDGVICGGLGVLVMPFMMYERNQAVIAMWYCPRSSDGLKLLREFKTWMSTKPMIRQVVYSEERKSDCRISKYLQKVGFQDCLPTHVLTR